MRSRIPALAALSLMANVVVLWPDGSTLFNLHATEAKKILDELRELAQKAQ